MAATLVRANGKTALWLLLVGVGVLLATLDFGMWGDGDVRYHMLLAVLEGAPWPKATRYSLLGPLFSTPLYLLGRLLGDAEAWCARFNVVVFLVVLFAMLRALREHLRPEVGLRFALCLAFCSMFPAHLEQYYGEVFSASLIALGSLWIVQERHAPWGWLLAALATVNMPGIGVGLLLLVAVEVLARRRLRVLLVLPLTVVLISIDSWIRTGIWWGAYVEEWLLKGTPQDRYADGPWMRSVMPYAGPESFVYPLGFGVMNIFFSFGKGLVWFVPGLWLAWAFYRDETLGVSKALREVVARWLLVTAGMVLLYAHWYAWHGEWFWGPRFFLLACFPASLVLVVTADAPKASIPIRVTALAAFTLSYWVGVNGAVFGTAASGICLRNDGALLHLCENVPEFSVLWRPFVVWIGVSGTKAVFWAYATLVYGYLAYPTARALWSRGRRWARAATLPGPLRW